MPTPEEISEQLRQITALVEDDMAMLRFTDGDYGWVTVQIADVARRHAGGRMVSMLEGGYALSALGRSAVPW